MSSRFTVTYPVGRVIRSDFTSSGYLRPIYTPALVMFATKSNDYAAMQLQAFAESYTIQCYVGYPLDGVRPDELALKEILAQAVGKVDVRFPSYVLFGVTGKAVYDARPLSVSMLHTFVRNNTS